MSRKVCTAARGSGERRFSSSRPGNRRLIEYRARIVASVGLTSAAGSAAAWAAAAIRSRTI
jgi:hypothetical protein